MLSIPDLLVVYVACLSYLGFWYGLIQVRNTMTIWDRVSLILVSTVMMPVVLPIGIIVGLRRMMLGQVIVLDVIERRRDGSVVGEHRIYWPNPDPC